MVISVGKLYHPGRRAWSEGSHYSFRKGKHELLVCLASPTTAEVQSYRSDQFDVALVVEGPLLVLLYRSGEGWSDAPFSIHLVPEAEREPPHLDGLTRESRAILPIVLIDAATGIVRVARAVSLDPAFTRTLHESIAAQLRMPWDAATYDAALAKLYGRHPSTESLLAVAKARTIGGL